jgi:hypothetical protein
MHCLRPLRSLLICPNVQAMLLQIDACPPTRLFWVMTIAMAEKCFGPTSRQLMRLPVLYSIPGIYSTRYTISHRPSLRLVSVRAARSLQSWFMGRFKKMAHVAAARRVGTTTPRALFVYKHFQNTSSDPQGQDPSTRPNHSNTPTDDSYGIASIPVLRSRRVIPLEERTCVEDMNFGAGKIRILPIWNHLCLMIRIGCSRSCKIVSDPGLNVWTIPSIAMAEINWCLLLWRQNLKRRIDMLPYIATKPHLAIRLQYSKR